MWQLKFSYSSKQRYWLNHTDRKGTRGKTWHVLTVPIWQVYFYPFHPRTQSQSNSSSSDKMPEIACFHRRDVSWRWCWQETRLNEWMNKCHCEAWKTLIFQLICRRVQAVSASLDGVCFSLENFALVWNWTHRKTRQCQSSKLFIFTPSATETLQRCLQWSFTVLQAKCWGRRRSDF